jgi:hypothetical protein
LGARSSAAIRAVVRAAPEALIVDITHEVQTSVRHDALMLWCARRSCPSAPNAIDWAVAPAALA